MKNNNELTVSQRRALVMAHPDFMYRSSTGYHFNNGPWGQPYTLAAAFARCFAPFCVRIDANRFAVSLLAGDPAHRQTVRFFDTPEAAAEYASRNSKCDSD